MIVKLNPRTCSYILIKSNALSELLVNFLTILFQSPAIRFTSRARQVPFRLVGNVPHDVALRMTEEARTRIRVVDSVTFRCIPEIVASCTVDLIRGDK